ncbi:MAG TPA: hypothetical protein VN947_14515 [Polyangia bacterium]|nr:hypothetical protein [Polyangia bacterium]
MNKALGLVAALALATLSACGDNNNNGTPDLAMQQGGGNDMTMMESCVMNPTTAVELLNACTTAQTGDPTKDAPYFPSLAPNGNLPPLP